MSAAGVGHGDIEGERINNHGVRLALEASHEHGLETGARLQPLVEVSVRYDGGDWSL